MKKMVITGVNGFIGRSAKEFFEKEYEVTGIDMASCYGGNEDGIHYYQCNMSQEAEKLSDILKETCPDVILHCAGSANVGASVSDPMADLDGNLHSLYVLLLALKESSRQPKIIFFSSAAVYGNPEHLPIHERDPLAPVSPYGLHKRMGEELCHYYNRVHGYRIRSIRIFSAYGSGLRKQILWDMYQKYKKSGRITLFGTGEETRDFIHVSDIMQAIRLVIEYDGGEEVFNVANGEEITIRSLAETYAKKLGETPDIVSFNGVTKEGDPKEWRADISPLKKLGYHKTMDMEKGIEEYIGWVRQEENKQ